MRLVVSTLATGLILAISGMPAHAAEVCGDGQDNDSDGYADEGCYPTGITGICESPLSCSRTGAVSPKTGNLVYRMPPDLTPKVAYGPGIAFQRVYMAQYEPGYNFPSATDFKAPLGYQWQHNYMSWLEWTDVVGAPDTVVLHNTKGQDVFLEFDSTSGGYDYYTPQVGYNVDYLRQDTSSPYHWELRTLTGQVFEYDWDGTNDLGMLVAIQDSLATPNEVTISYNGDGQVDTVTDATGEKWLEFEYFSTGTKLLQYVKYYTGTGAGTLRVTVEVTYSSNKLATAKYGSTTVQTYTYNGNDYLSLIEDADGNDIAGFTYATTTGDEDELVRLETGDGDMGFQYGVGGGIDTYVYYHRASTTSCDADADCGTGEYCGGETDTGGTNTGTCYKMRRSLVVTSDNEDLVASVSGPAGADFNDAVDVETYSWDTGTSGDALALDGVENAEDDWTSYARNSDGLVTKMVEGDNDADPDNTNPTTARVTYYTYGNSSFPGLVTEVKRQSEISTASCAAAATGCKTTTYTYNSNGQLTSAQEYGTTYEISGTSVADANYTYTTSYTYDSKGRVTQIDGPLSGTNDVVDYTYYATGDLEQEYLKEIKRKKDGSNYVTTTIDDYDFWGNAIELQDPDGTYTCRTYDSTYGYLSEVREAMNGQTSCATSHADDLVTTYTRDSWSRLEKIEYSEGNCTFYAYDSEGRLTSVKPRDDCTSSSNGHTIEYTYDIDGRRTKVEYKDKNGNVKKRQEYTYRASRRLGTAKNPVSTSYSKSYAYHDDGQRKSVAHENSLGKTEWTYDTLNRVDDLRRYTDTSTYDTWDLTPGDMLDLPTSVEDDDSKSIDWVWDDLNRKVKQVTPDSNTTYYVYDAAGNRTDMLEADGLSGEVDHSFTYDNLGRLLTADDDHIDCGAQQTDAELEYVYDDASSLCPVSTPCQSYDNTEGRLAYARATLWCDTAESDDTIDQETFYDYDDAGRLIGEYIIDDTGRAVEQTYEYDENGNATKIVAPSGVSMGYTRNPAGNSDQNRVKYLWRLEDSTTTYMAAVTGDYYLPGNGPLTLLRHYNVVSSETVYRSATYNLAYRPTEVRYYHGSTDMFEIDYTEDERGRITVRDFSHAESGVQDAYYTYDDLSRVTCDSGASGSCPTTGSNLKSNLSGTPAYTASGERVELTHYHSQWGEDAYPMTLETGKDQIDYVDPSGLKRVDYAWDDRGNRTQDDHGGMSYDARDFTYDGRGNLLTVRGKFHNGTNFVWYTMTAAYDHKNRRIFKSVLDEDSGDEAHWFFYYDPYDRLIEIKHVPDIGSASTYTVFQLYWLDNQPVAYYQIDDAGGSPTTTRRYWHTDELNRPLEVWTYPTGGATSTRVWAINPDLFGWDDIVLGSSVYQPLRFPGQYFDEETVSWENSTDPARPALHYNWHRTYDPYTGTYLQVDPMVEDTWEAYNYVGQNPVGMVDRTGLLPSFRGADWQAEMQAELPSNCMVAAVGYNVSFVLCLGGGAGGLFFDGYGASFGICYPPSRWTYPKTWNAADEQWYSGIRVNVLAAEGCPIDPWMEPSSQFSDALSQCACWTFGRPSADQHWQLCTAQPHPPFEIAAPPDNFGNPFGNYRLVFRCGWAG